VGVYGINILSLHLIVRLSVCYVYDCNNIDSEFNSRSKDNIPDE
jgi:hypothetical protein